MYGFLIFSNLCLNLSEECRDRLLGNIFGISAVAVSSVRLEDKRIIFKLFSHGVFYQYVIVMGTGKDEFYRDERIINCMIFTDGGKFSQFNDFIYRLFQCQDEYQVYQLVRGFL